MKRFLSFPRLSMLFLGMFGLMVAGIFVFQGYWVNPGDRCTAKGYWYDMETRTCAMPVYVPDITKRPAGVSRADASNEKNRELLSLEAQVAAYDRAAREQTARDAAALKAKQPH